jgi:hypothetical protein
MTSLRRRERWEDLVFIRLNLQGRNVQLVDHEKQHDGLTSVTSPTEHLVNETSEINETSETDNLMAREIKSKRKGKDVSINDDDFLLFEPDGSDEADEEMKEKHCKMIAMMIKKHIIKHYMIFTYSSTTS